MSFALLFVDDHPLYREGVRHTLRESLANLSVHLAEDEATALACLRHEPDIDLVLADQRLAQTKGLDLLDRIGLEFPTVARGLLCADLTPQLAAAARDSGCIACLDKQRDINSLAYALDTIFNGGIVFDVPPRPEPPTRLSEKRQEIVRLAALGCTNKEIARQMGISERTVKDHWSYIFTTLGVGSRAEAVSQAHRLNFL